jgi:hypothetical protein
MQTKGAVVSPHSSPHSKTNRLAIHAPLQARPFYSLPRPDTRFCEPLDLNAKRGDNNERSGTSKQVRTRKPFEP